MIAIALGLIGLVVMVTTGIAVSSSGDDHLAFLGVGVDTTTAQVFLTGAILAWVFVIALWLLRYGVQRSSMRGAQLASRRARRSGEDAGVEIGVEAGAEIAETAEVDWEGRRETGPGTWLGFGEADMRPSPGAGHAGPGAYLAGRTDAGQPAESGESWFGAARPGPTGDDGGPPQRGDGGPDLTHLSVAVAPDKPGAASSRDTFGPGTGGVGPGSGFLGIGVDRRGQGRQIGR